MLYVSFMVSTKQKLIDKQKRKGKEFKHTTIEYHQNTKEDSMRGRKEKKEQERENSQETMNKMPVLGPYV